MSVIRRLRSADIVPVAALLLLAVLARFAGWRVETNDMHIFFQWYHQVGAVDRGHRLGAEVGNYNAPFVYLLTLVLYLPGPLLFKLKAVFVVFDMVLGFVTYRIVVRHRGGRRVPMAAALVVVLLPTVVINASFYGQMDAMWAAPALGGVYFLLRDRPWYGVATCALALAVKPQGVFVFPLLLLLAMAGRLPWRTLLAVPAVMLLVDLPAIVSGRDPVELLTIYDMDRQARNVPALSLRAPSLYAFVPPAPHDDVVRNLGYALAAAVVIGICWYLSARGIRMTRERLVTAAAFFAVAVPFLLPGMHERYFFLADVTTVVLAVFRPRLWFVPALVQAASLLAYQPYLFERSAPTVPMPVAATLMLAAVLVVGYVLVRTDAETPPEPSFSPPATRRELLPAHPA